MDKYQRSPPDGPKGKWHAHHIIPFAISIYESIRSIARGAGIDLNSYVNGVWLEAQYHWHLHTTEYFNLLQSKILPGMTATQIIKALDEIRKLLENGWPPK